MIVSLIWFFILKYFTDLSDVDIVGISLIMFVFEIIIEVILFCKLWGFI